MYGRYTFFLSDDAKCDASLITRVKECLVYNPRNKENEENVNIMLFPHLKLTFYEVVFVMLSANTYLPLSIRAALLYRFWHQKFPVKISG